jgi:cyclohexadienyl dehydratase
VKPRLARTIAALVAATTCAACGAKSPQTDIDRIVADGVLRVCSTGDYRPFSYRDPQGQWSGMDVDLANGLAHSLGVTVQWEHTSWPTLLADLDTRCDIAMGGITVTADRAEHALFTDSYLRDGKAAVVRCSDASRFRSLADIDRPGVRVVVNPGGTNEQFVLTQLSHATVVEYPDNNTIFDQLTAGRADAMITDVSEIRWQTTQNRQLCPVSTDNPFTVAQKAYLLRSSATGLRERVNKWLADIRADGSYALISRRWLGVAIGPDGPM